jgi:hypothetical protein
MRAKLAAIAGTRCLFRATFVRFGSKPAYKGAPIKTCLFENVTRRGSVVTDHLRFVCGVQFERLNLQAGDVVEFHARVTEYWKGYKGRRDVDAPLRKDYRLSNPTGVKKVTADEQLPMFKEGL